MFFMQSKTEACRFDELASEKLELNKKQQIISWAEELVLSNQSKAPPVDIESLAVKVGIKEIRKDNISADGILVPIENGFVLTINKNAPLTRQRFTCAHEIAHTFFEPSDIKLRTPVDEETRVASLQKDKIEHLCNIGATHILMPDQMFKQASLGMGLSIEAISQLADMFETSILTTAMRFVEISREPIILIFSEVFDRPESSPKLRVRWSVQKTKPFGLKSYFIPTNVPINEESNIASAYKTGNTYKVFEKFNIGSLRGSYHTESKGFISREGKYALSLIFPKAQTSTFF